MVRKEQPANTHCPECGKKFEASIPPNGVCAEHSASNKSAWEASTPTRNDEGTVDF